MTSTEGNIRKLMNQKHPIQEKKSKILSQDEYINTSKNVDIESLNEKLKQMET